MRRIPLGLLAALVLLLAFPVAAGAQADLNCRDFPSRAAAQARLDADRSDPHGLDGDEDGLACDKFDYAGQAAGSGDEAGGPDPLPFTGPGERLLPLGAMLLTAGLTLAVVARRRPRHARR
jgi:hypothetical protein